MCTFGRSCSRVLVGSITIAVALVMSTVAQASFIYVDDDNTGTEDGSRANPYNTISEGVNNSSTGDTIYVSAGDYDEKVGITNRANLALIGEGYETKITQATDFKIQIQKSTNIVISGFRIDGGEEGISIGNSGRVIIEDCTIENCSQNSITAIPKVFRLII